MLSKTMIINSFNWSSKHKYFNSKIFKNNTIPDSFMSLIHILKHYLILILILSLTYLLMLMSMTMLINTLIIACPPMFIHIHLLMFTPKYANLTTLCIHILFVRPVRIVMFRLIHYLIQFRYHILTRLHTHSHIMNLNFTLRHM